ncbi:MAG: HAMP domain-containing histidine kinase [Bacteroidaceae bacterium]|nr:HAMP domain-containing histidine kinase [Bacteroidaceae bacterium]
MKKGTIIAIAIVMGFSFIILLFLEANYIREMHSLRVSQVNTCVNKALRETVQSIELDETRRVLEFTLKNDKSDSLFIRQFQADSARIAKKYPARRRIYEQQLLRQRIRERFKNKNELLEKVMHEIIAESDNRVIEERINFNTLTETFAEALKNNGLKGVEFHYVITHNGDTVYDCHKNIVDKGSHRFRTSLFNDDLSPERVEMVVFIPNLSHYINDSLQFLIPAIVFTVVLLLMFCYTVYIIFRQKRLTEIKNDFINNMTHEFKTPISTISLASQMLQDTSVTKSEHMLKHLCSIIADETNRLRFQVEKILQISMFERNGGVYQRKDIDVVPILEKVVSTFRLKVESAGGTLTTNITADDTHIFGDSMHITNVLFNLLDNAIKYKSGDRRLLLDISLENDDDKLVIKVVDNGIGIKRDDLKRVFDRFYRVSTGNKHDVKGFGLGLAYVKNVVNFHKGTIHVDSTFGKGTKFTISIPILKQKS